MAFRYSPPGRAAERRLGRIALREEISVGDGRRQPDKLVVVIHGVGDPAPGETLSLFTRSLALQQQPLLETRDTLWLNDKPGDDGFIKTFPAHQNRIDYADEKIELVEAFWGDLSRVRRGPFGLIVGMFQILFGLRYVAWIAADQPGTAARWLKQLGLISSRILHGPVLAVTFYLAILTAAVSGTQMMWPQSWRGMLWTQVVLAVCAAIAITAAQVGYRFTRSRVVERFWFWVNITTMFVTGLMAIRHLLDSPTHAAFTQAAHPGLIWYCRVLVVLMGLLWFVETLVVIAMAGCWATALFHSKASRRGLHAAFLLPALAVGIWGLTLPMLWISAREGVDRMSRLPEFAALFDQAIPLLGVQFAMLMMLGIVTVLVLIRYAIARLGFKQMQFESGRRVPRLIVHPGQQFAMGVCTMIGMSLVLTTSLLEFWGYSWREHQFGLWMAESNKYAIALLVPLGGILVFLLPRLRSVFDIVLDVVNHFYFRSTNMIDALDDDDEFDIRETTFEGGSLFFSRRDAIHVRVKRILVHYRDTWEHRPELIIVSHSQGTMAAIETLNDPELDWLSTRFDRITLVTMGSPLSNLYQHYFRHLYPSLDAPAWQTLRQRVCRWVNIFRIDDFVGTEIDFVDPKPVDPIQMHRHHSAGPTSHESAANWHTGHDHAVDQIDCSNHAVGCRGHVNYWADAEVLAVLRDQVFSADASNLSESQSRPSAERAA